MMRTILSDPGMALLAALFLLLLILVFPVFAAFRRRARRKQMRPLRRQGAEIKREPRIGGRSSFAYLDDEDEDDDPPMTGGFGTGPRRGKPLPIGGLIKIAWFGLGVAVGAGAMAVGGGMLGIGRSPAAPVEPPPLASAEDEPAAPAAVADAPSPSAEDAIRLAEEALAGLPPEPADEEAPKEAPPAAAASSIDAQLGAFVSGMQAQLPLAIGGETNLVRVDAVAKVVTLGFSILRTIPEADFPALQRTLEERFKTGICGNADNLRIRALNDGGISFRVVYADLIGQTVASMDVPPRFCAGEG